MGLPTLLFVLPLAAALGPPTLEDWSTDVLDVQVCGLPSDGAPDCLGSPYTEAACGHARCCWKDDRCVAPGQVRRPAQRPRSRRTRAGVRRRRPRDAPVLRRRPGAGAARRAPRRRRRGDGRRRRRNVADVPADLRRGRRRRQRRGVPAEPDLRRREASAPNDPLAPARARALRRGARGRRHHRRHVDGPRGLQRHAGARASAAPLGIQLFRESTTRRSASTSRIRRTRPSTCPSRRSWSPKSSGSRQRPFGVGKP